MTSSPSAPTAEQDQQIELAIGNLLRVGVLLAAALVLAGGVLLLRHPAAPAPDLTHFRAPATSLLNPLSSISGVFRQLASFSAASIIELGLLVLIATPIVRVLFAVVGFARERDRLYVWISIAVLTILLLSLVRGG